VGHLLRGPTANYQVKDRTGDKITSNAIAAVSNDPLECAHHDADVRAFTQWTHQMPSLQAGSMAQASEPGDPARGREVFEKRCTGCHSLEENREGPKLQGVYGRTSGKAPGFTYSEALIKAAIVWDEVSLEQWLADTDAFVPGNNMDFRVPKPQERRDLASFLKQQSGK